MPAISAGIFFEYYAISRTGTHFWPALALAEYYTLEHETYQYPLGTMKNADKSCGTRGFTVFF
jgi:hypothetical protein